MTGPSGTAAPSRSPIRNWTGTSDGLDENQNYAIDPGERKIYLEVSDFSAPSVFYESPR